MIETACVHEVVARILGSQKGSHICFRKCYLITYNCNFAKCNWILYILTTILGGFLLVIWLCVFALWFTYCAPISAGMCPHLCVSCFQVYGEQYSFTWVGPCFNTLRTGDSDLRFYITTVQDGWGKSAFLTRAYFPCTIHLIMPYIEPVSEWFCWRMFIETWPHSELNFRHRASSI